SSWLSPAAAASLRSRRKAKSALFWNRPAHGHPPASRSLAATYTCWSGPSRPLQNWRSAKRGSRAFGRSQKTERSRRWRQFRGESATCLSKKKQEIQIAKIAKIARGRNPFNSFLLFSRGFVLLL